jgi:hypothetical protein
VVPFHLSPLPFFSSPPRHFSSPPPNMGHWRVPFLFPFQQPFW